LIAEIKTPRLLLRRWRPEDRDPFAEMSADPAVMEYYLSVRSRAQSDARVDEIEAEFARIGFGKWAVEIPGKAPFAGCVGLSAVLFEASFTPCVEIGWRLARPFWGNGYATEAALAAMEDGFKRVGLQEIVSFTIPGNTRSIRVMQKIGMTKDGEFDHPRLPEGHPLRRHVLYRRKA
jgi:RimJ/RimL family protein N-acetyltransferase